MGFQDYIGEREACAFAGVSPSTLRRFAEAGYFQIETDSDGLRLFSKAEIESLFGLKPLSASRPRPPASATGATPPPVTPRVVEPANEEIKRAPEMPSVEPVVAERSATTVVRAPVVESPRSAPPVEAAPIIAPQVASPAPARPEAIEALEREVTKLQNIVALQEKLLDIREEEIRSIKGERDWLRSRIEKLEEKNERDQLLLLAETQTVRQLINLQQKKRSTVQLALEWLGLKSPNAAPGAPIDISPAAPRPTGDGQSR